MPASKQFTASERASRARLAAQDIVPGDAWITVEFPAPLLGLSSWGDVLATVLATKPHDDENGLVAVA
jgi:hypothetical protein